MPSVSHCIRRRTAANIHHAVRVAEAKSLPLNTFVTLNFSRTACETEKASELFADLRNTRYSHWARRPTSQSGARPHAPTYIWVIEAGGGVTAAHWLLHVPRERRVEFEQRLARWVEDVIGAASANAIKVQDARTPKGATKYMLKGMDPAWAAIYGINFEDQGAVNGRRCGYTLNLGPTEKKKMRAAGQYRHARMWRRPSAEPEIRPT